VHWISLPVSVERSIKAMFSPPLKSILPSPSMHDLIHLLFLTCMDFALLDFSSLLKFSVSCFLSLYLYNDFEDFGCSKLYVLICCIEISINAFFLKKKKQKKICFFVECLFFYLSISSFNSILFSLIIRSRCDKCFFLLQY
jgi:hypothetical protein